MVRIDKRVGQFAFDHLDNFMMGCGGREQDPVQMRVALSISHEMMVGWLWKIRLEKLVLSTKMVKEITAVFVLPAHIKVTSDED